MKVDAHYGDARTSLRQKLAVLALATMTLLASVSMTVRAQSSAPAARANCDRACMADMVSQLLKSMVAHNPDTLPLASVYMATENSHPAALGMMTLWRTMKKTGKPDFMAVDVQAGQVYVETQISEGAGLSLLWGRMKVVDRKLTEIELYVNRSRGDHGFSFSAEQAPVNLVRWMTPPAGRKKATRAELEKLSRAAFDASNPYTVGIATDCQFLEIGSLVIDPGLDDEPQPASAGAAGPARDPNAPLGCLFPPNRPSDSRARPIVIDDELGIVVVAAVVPGLVYPYPFHGHMLSAFIPGDMKEPQQIQDKWFDRHVQAHKAAVLQPTAATGEAMQVLQLYDGKLEGSQINVYLSGPDMHSVWVKQ